VQKSGRRRCEAANVATLPRFTGLQPAVATTRRVSAIPWSCLKGTIRASSAVYTPGRN
jgi:hypothetical protein